VPHGSGADATERIEAQIERFAPGFRELVVARSVLKPADLERHNANLVGGDFSGGAHSLTRFVTRPLDYETPLPGVYLCSSSTPPGGGVHGMCGFLAARAALGTLRR
jgi:phytoene dehydrogenase-like protein